MSIEAGEKLDWTRATSAFAILALPLPSSDKYTHPIYQEHFAIYAQISVSHIKFTKTYITYKYHWNIIWT